MLIAVISDVHSNLEALDAVLTRASQAGAARLLVLGDIVGYGADPGAVVDRLASHRSATILGGNHDLAATGRFDTRWFNSMAAAAIEWTKQVASDDTLGFLSKLEPRADSADGLLVHGSVREPATEYVNNNEVAAVSFETEDFTICFYGHTHLPAVFARAGGGNVTGRALRDGDVVDLRGGQRFMLNPGSVGQPRDGDARASLMLYDAAAGRAHVERVSYDVGRAQQKIRDAGLPSFLADRLAAGA